MVGPGTLMPPTTRWLSTRPDPLDPTDERTQSAIAHLRQQFSIGTVHLLHPGRGHLLQTLYPPSMPRSQADANPALNGAYRTEPKDEMQLTSDDGMHLIHSPQYNIDHIATDLHPLPPKKRARIEASSEGERSSGMSLIGLNLAEAITRLELSTSEIPLVPAIAPSTSRGIRTIDPHRSSRTETSVSLIHP